jgi:hypothetical protein
MLAASWGAITALTVFALWRTMKAPPGELSAPLDLEAEIEELEDKKEGR